MTHGYILPNIVSSMSGSITIGAYGTCESLDARGICANAPIINLNITANPNGNNNPVFTRNFSDVRIQDITFNCLNPSPTTGMGIITGGTDIFKVLIML